MDNNLQDSWCQQQQRIAEQVIASDENSWHHYFSSETCTVSETHPLFFAGVDISFPSRPDQLQHAVGSITVVKIPSKSPGETSELVLSHSRLVQITNPYIAGFLAFREAPAVGQLLQELPSDVRNCIHCVLLDGNGVLHPRKAGLACHVGVQHNIPTIGVSKTLLCVDGLDEHAVRNEVASHPHSHDGVDITGHSGYTWAKALLTGNATNKPVYVSIGHRVSLDTAARVCKYLSTFRVPDPIRYADMHSRAFLRGHPISIYHPEDFKSKPHGDI